MATIHLIEGPVGAGKTTFARQLGREIGAPALNLDAWMVTLFRPDRPDEDFLEWYRERKERCLQQIWDVAQSVLDAGSDVILELGLVQRADRERFYARVARAPHDLRVRVLEAPRDVRRARVQARNLDQGPTFQMEVPDQVFEMASDMWQPPDDEEISRHQIEIVDARI